MSYVISNRYLRMWSCFYVYDWQCLYQTWVYLTLHTWYLMYECCLSCILKAFYLPWARGSFTNIRQLFPYCPCAFLLIQGPNSQAERKVLLQLEREKTKAICSLEKELEVFSLILSPNHTSYYSYHPVTAKLKRNWMDETDNAMVHKISLKVHLNWLKISSTLTGRVQFWIPFPFHGSFSFHKLGRKTGRGCRNYKSCFPLVWRLLIFQIRCSVSLWLNFLMNVPSKCDEIYFSSHFKELWEKTCERKKMQGVCTWRLFSIKNCIN